MKIAAKALVMVVLLASARMAAQHQIPRKACRFLTYVTHVQTSGVNASLLDHLLLGIYYANEPGTKNRVIS